MNFAAFVWITFSGHSEHIQNISANFGMTKKDIIQDLERNIFCRIQVSPIEGVGVFAIRDIPKGMNPFVGAGKPRFIRVPLEDIMKNKKIPAAVKKLPHSFLAIHKGIVWFPNHGMNQIDISYFMNHSDRPNIECCKDGEEFRAKRLIKTGEELLIDYGEFSDE